MAKIFITGSSDGLGLRTANALTKQGHRVYLHARNAQRAQDATTGCPAAESCLIADLSSTEETKTLASELNRLGPWDAIIHNAGLYRVASGMKGKEGLPALFAVNTLAPYMLTQLVDPPPKKMVFVSSQLHSGGSPGSLMESCGYGDSKLHNIMLAFGYARRFEGQGIQSNSLDPGWVPTKMGGAGASDDIQKAVDTYVMLTLGEGAANGQTGKHWYQCRERSFKAVAGDVKAQDQLLSSLKEISGV
jgi:NAD(P)-dependent dehydrogenase (short-subunit alcohol dehydrogenase family)